MLSGEFERKIRKLNRNLRVYCRDNPRTPAGIFLLQADGTVEDVCGIDKNYVPEHSEFHPDGQHKKGGWRRALRLLINRRLIERRQAERVFSTHLEYAPRIPRAKRINVEDKLKAFESKYGAWRA